MSKNIADGALVRHKLWFFHKTRPMTTAMLRHAAYRGLLDLFIFLVHLALCNFFTLAVSANGVFIELMHAAL